VRPVLTMGTRDVRKTCRETVRHADDCVALNRAEAAYNAGAGGLHLAWLTDIRRHACCGLLRAREPRECGWTGDVEVEMAGGAEDFVETELWRCPRCGADHVEEVV
jgi:hypothetical protein